MTFRFLDGFLIDFIQVVVRSFERLRLPQPELIKNKISIKNHQINNHSLLVLDFHHCCGSDTCWAVGWFVFARSARSSV